MDPGRKPSALDVYVCPTGDEGDSMPFEPENPIPVLAQVGPKSFELQSRFEYKWKEEEEPFVVPKDDAESTYDLTSIPGYLTWLVPKYGLHTAAVLLHDDWVESTTPPTERARYDWMFRDALGDLKVPFLRRWTLWAGTNIGTRQKRSKLEKYASWLWVAVLAISSAIFWWDRLASVSEWDPITWGLFGSWWQPILIIVAAAVFLLPDPVPLAPIGSLMVLLLLPATLAVLATLAAYVALDWSVKTVFRGVNRFGPGDGPDLLINDTFLMPKEERQRRRKEYFAS